MNKRIIFSLVSFLLLSAYCFSNDDDEDDYPFERFPGTKYEYKGLDFGLVESSHEAALTSANSWVGELIIPSEISYNNEIYTVSQITNNAFFKCNQLTKVTIPKTVYNIWQHYPETIAIYKNLFKSCNLLTTVEVDSANQWLCTVDNVLFSKDTTVLYAYPPALPNRSYSVPESVVTIGGGAFRLARNLTSIHLPLSITRIDASAFYQCSNLENINLTRLTSIGAYMFFECKSLKSLEIPSTVTSVGRMAFYGCESLKILDFPSSVVSLDEFFVSGCKMERLIIRGIVNKPFPNYVFDDLDTSATLYVPRSEVARYKEVYAGTVLPLSELPTNIQSLSEKKKESSLSDLQGRRLSRIPEKGMYIKDGKKYVK